MGDASAINRLSIICDILLNYDIHDLLRSVPEDERNFEERALVKIWQVVTG